MKKTFTSIILCLIMLFVTIAPANADIDFRWFEKRPAATPQTIYRRTTSTPAPQVTASPSVSCDLCGDTGYVALKAGNSDEYVAVPCPECSNSGADNTDPSTYENGSDLDTTIARFMSYYESRCAENNLPFVFTEHDVAAEKVMPDIAAAYRNEEGTVGCNFYRTENDQLSYIQVTCNDDGDDGDLETMAYAAIFLAESITQIDQAYVDWCLETAKMLAPLDEDAAYSYDLSGCTVEFEKVALFLDGSAYVYHMKIY